MANVTDVARYILEQRGAMTTMKLQKLVYYCQAWGLVWDEQPLYPNTIKAWTNGPVVPDLWKHHRGLYRVVPVEIPGDSANLTPTERETIDAVLSHYGDKSAQYLIELTHSESPWRNARGTRPAEEQSSPEIRIADMAEYYSGLIAPPPATLATARPTVVGVGGAGALVGHLVRTWEVAAGRHASISLPADPTPEDLAGFEEFYALLKQEIALVQKRKRLGLPSNPPEPGS